MRHFSPRQFLSRVFRTLFFRGPEEETVIPPRVPDGTKVDAVLSPSGMVARVDGTPTTGVLGLAVFSALLFVRAVAVARVTSLRANIAWPVSGLRSVWVEARFVAILENDDDDEDDD